MTHVIHLHDGDDWAALRDQMRRAADERVIIDLPWEARLLVRPLDVDMVLREAERLGQRVAAVSRDPERRSMLRRAGLPAFGSLSQAEAGAWQQKQPDLVNPPRRRWWQEEIPLWPPPGGRFIPRWARRARTGLHVLVFIATVLLLFFSAYVVVPQASITMVPERQVTRVIVPVSASVDIESPDIEASLVPARRVGDYFQGYLEIETTGLAPFSSGRASGTVLFTNLLGQDVAVPAGTVVRTSASSFPVRFQTTESIVVPPLGQAPAAVEALDEGLVGNVRSNQINQIEGFLAFSLRVTNPDAVSGGALQDVRAASQEDRDRLQALLTVQLLEEARSGLLGYLEPTEFLLPDSLEIQGTEVSYNRFLNERADTVGLNMRLLLTAIAVDQDDAKSVAYATLIGYIPEGYTLTRTEFEFGEMAEEPLNADLPTFFVTATAYTAADIDVGQVRDVVLGRPLGEAIEELSGELPVAEDVQISVWPDWLDRMPLLPLRITTDVVLGE